MSPAPLSRSPDLKRLQDEGFEVSIQSGYLVLDHVPYVDAARTVQYGRLVCELNLSGDVTAAPHTHVAMFSGTTPCHADGSPLTRIINDSSRRELAEGLVIDHTFSSKPLSGSYPDYYEQMTTYARILSSQAEAIDPTATAKTFRMVDADDDSPFVYHDTATSRAGTDVANAKLRMGRVAIVGLGGTGSYILDYIAKAPIRQIDLFDGDVLFQHNAFRSPGAASCEDLAARPTKADYFAARYSRLHGNIVAHPYFINETNTEELLGSDFVFLALDRGAPKQYLVSQLDAWHIPFIDVGMGVEEDSGVLGGMLRVSTVTPERPLSAGGQQIPFSDGDGNDDYSRNIQIVELNALNAALAVIRWKKHCGFYRDLEREHLTIYTVDGNHLLNEAQA